jgi:hypothetical protein
MIIGPSKASSELLPALFDELHERIAPFITKAYTNYRKAIEPEMKLTTKLCRLVTVDSYATLQCDFRVFRNTIRLLVNDVCEALVGT